MLRPTRYVRQQAGGSNKFLGGSGTPQNRNNMVMGVTALIAITGLVYWWGYRDVDKRHRGDATAKKT